NDESQALFYLRKALSHLRQALGGDAARLLAPDRRIVRLDMTGAFVDVLAFDSALRRAATAADPAALLQEAVALYRGPLLADCPEEWAAVERNHREQAYLAALESLGTHFYTQGDAASSVHWLRLLIVGDPYRESAYLALMQSLADCGDKAAVNVVYQDLRLRLLHDLNTTPSPTTEALYRQLSRQERPAVPVSPPSPDTPATRRHLPVPLSDLIGREEQIAEVLGWMQKRRLVTLVGPGGIGKTRLAIAAAEAAMPRFEEGVWFVDLAPLSDPARVSHAAAKALGIVEERGRSLRETLVKELAACSLLLVLDNCEHLPEACAELAHLLLSACPTLCMVATSRQALNVMGEQVYPVPSLPVPPLEVHRHEAGREDLEKDPHVLMEYEAVRLFVDRASRVNSSFRLQHRNGPVVVDICRQLDGIPLAIEMAAARLRSLTVGEIRIRLADRFRLLTSGNRGVLPRQQTLRAAIDWSYDQLSKEEQAALRHLSVFAGGWMREAAEAISDDEAVADTLASLVDKSLVLRQEGEAETVRYGMLETIRQYALERLEETGERAEIRGRHRDYLLTWVEAGRPKLAGPERALWLSALEVEHDNLRRALSFCREEPESGEQGLRLAAALWGFWSARGHLSEGRDHLTALLSHPGAQVRTRVHADVLNGAGALAFYQSDYVAALALHAEGLILCRELGDQKGVASALANQGNVAASQADYAAARALYEESVATMRLLGDRQSAATILSNWGNVVKEQGDYDTACALHEESLAIQRELGNRNGIANSLNNLGVLADTRGDSPVAQALYRESLKIHRELGARTAEASNLAGLGNIALRQGDYLLARSLYEESLAIRQSLGDSWGIAISLQGLGAASASLGDYASAHTQYGESLAIRQNLGDRLGVATSLQAFASLAQQCGGEEHAARLWGAMSALHDAIGSALSSDQRAELEGGQAAACGVIGTDAFMSAWEEGRAMSMEAAIRYALQKVPSGPHRHTLLTGNSN
ncbi:MAG: hypothetical protein JWN14_3022, partial [Chthonomonadales bacterium]|nr:hypothetical protein [Chthonomonadales bacterium]